MKKAIKFAAILKQQKTILYIIKLVKKEVKGNNYTTKIKNPNK